MGNALGKSLAGTVDAGNNAAKELVRCENLKNTIFYEHTFSMKLPYRVGQVSLFGGIILLVVAIIFTKQHSKKDEKETSGHKERDIETKKTRKKEIKKDRRKQMKRGRENSRKKRKINKADGEEIWNEKKVIQ